MAMLIGCMIVVTLPPAASADGTPKPHATVATPSDPYAAFVTEAAHRFGIPEGWIRAVRHAESRGDPLAVSPKGAMGLMQIMPSTWRELRVRYDLGDNPIDPRTNILAGAAYLHEMHDRYGTIGGMLAAYNAGPGRYDEHLATGRTLPAETVDYVAKITPMIDGTAAIASIYERRPRPSWTRAPIFVARSIVPEQDVPAPADLPSGRPADTSPIVDLSALVPPSDGLFVQRPTGQGGQR